MKKIITVSIDEDILASLDRCAVKESRSRSNLLELFIIQCVKLWEEVEEV